MNLSCCHFLELEPRGCLESEIRLRGLLDPDLDRRLAARFPRSEGDGGVCGLRARLVLLFPPRCSAIIASDLILNPGRSVCLLSLLSRLDGRRPLGLRLLLRLSLLLPPPRRGGEADPALESDSDPEPLLEEEL